MYRLRAQVRAGRGTVHRESHDRRPHSLLRRNANDLELPFAVGSTTVREPQKVERLRPVLPPAPPSIGRKSPELNQPRFIGVKNQPEFCEPFL
jgi:hypothetical protein